MDYHHQTVNIKSKCRFFFSQQDADFCLNVTCAKKHQMVTSHETQHKKIIDYGNNILFAYQLHNAANSNQNKIYYSEIFVNEKALHN
jgi:hypothetical protein